MLACVPMPNTILIQLYYTPGNITRAVLELELLRVWPFPPIVLGCRNSSKNRLLTELGCPQTSQQQFRECKIQWLQLCGSRSLHKQIPHHKLNPHRNLDFGRERGKFQKEEKALDSFAAFPQVKAPCPSLEAPITWNINQPN